MPHVHLVTAGSHVPTLLFRSTMPPGEAELQKVVAVKISSNWNANVHLTCGLWAPEVYEDNEGNLVSQYQAKSDPQ